MPQRLVKHSLSELEEHKKNWFPALSETKIVVMNVKLVVPARDRMED